MITTGFFTRNNSIKPLLEDHSERENFHFDENDKVREAIVSCTILAYLMMG